MREQNIFISEVYEVDNEGTNEKLNEVVLFQIRIDHFTCHDIGDKYLANAAH